jgi:hypothetical protein
MVDAVNAHLGFPASGLAGMLAPSGHHPGGDHHPLPEPEGPDMPGGSGPGPVMPGAPMEA